MRLWTAALRDFDLRMTASSHFPALPHRSIAVRFTSVNGHSTRRGTAGPVGFMTIWPASPSRPFFTLTISLAKINFQPSPLTIFVKIAKFPAHQDEDIPLLTNLLIRGKVVFPKRGCGRGKRQPKRIAGLSLMRRAKESDMAKPTRSESGLNIDRRRLLASVAALSLGNIPNVEAAEVSNSGKAFLVAEIPTSDSTAWNVCAGTAQKIEEIAARNIIRAEAGLPLLSIPRELRRMKMVEDAAEFEQFADRHRQAVLEEVLAPVREARGEPDWRPTRLMEGLAFQAQVGKILRERFEAARTSSNKTAGL